MVCLSPNVLVLRAVSLYYFSRMKFYIHLQEWMKSEYKILECKQICSYLKWSTFLFASSRELDKKYQVIILGYIFLKHMLWVLIRSAYEALLMSTHNICFFFFFFSLRTEINYPRINFKNSSIASSLILVLFTNNSILL